MNLKSKVLIAGLVFCCGFFTCNLLEIQAAIAVPLPSCEVSDAVGLVTQVCDSEEAFEVSLEEGHQVAWFEAGNIEAGILSTETSFYPPAPGHYQAKSFKYNPLDTCAATGMLLIDTCWSELVVDAYYEPLIISAGPDIDGYYSENITLVASEISDLGIEVTYDWYYDGMECLNCSEIEYLIRESTQVILEGENSAGCVANDTLNIEVSNCDFGVIVPSAFSPNNDRVNDIYRAHVIGEEYLTSFRLTIWTSHWAIPVFETSDPTIGWDGTFKGRDAATAVYFFLIETEFEIEYESACSRPVSVRGNFHLIR